MLELKKSDQKAIIVIKQKIDTETGELARRIGKLLYTEVKAVTGKRFYSLPQLKSMGHPYSKYFPKDFLMDDRIINLQTGGLHRSIRWMYIKGQTKTAKVWASAPYANSLIRGLGRQRPRDFFGLAYERALAKIPQEERRFLQEVENG